MDCLNPLTCYHCGTTVAKDGVVSPRFKFAYADAFSYWSRIAGSYMQTQKLIADNAVNLPCGKCAACLIRKRKDMSVRLAHERKMHEHACFITLTYNDENLPYVDEWVREETLVVAHVQKFIKRLRRHLEYQPKDFKKRTSRDHVVNPIRYFAVGEYGTRSRRPHYHIIIYGWTPSDAKLWQLRGNYAINRSAQVEKLWKYGFSTVCDVNVGVAKYCARYVTKKFARLDESPRLEDALVCPEFVLQSKRNGGMGATWLDSYSENLRTGFVTVSNGERISRCAVPRYYYDRLRKTNLPLWIELRDARLEFVRNFKTSSQDSEAVKRKVAVAMEAYRYQIEREQI